MLTKIDLNALAVLDAEATEGPWIEDRFDDEHFMTAIGVSANLTDKHGSHMS
jgi:hypothetical protein